METVRLDWAERGWNATLADLRVKAKAWRGRWVLLQYTTLAWSRRGFPLQAPRTLAVLRKSGVRCGVVFHDFGPAVGHGAIARVREYCHVYALEKLYAIAERAAGGEYAHAVPTRPEIGYRANSALIGPGEPIVRPADYGEPLVAEGELVAVIGRTARHCTRDEAKDVVLGWTIGNDVSARAWQRTDRTLWRAKNSDTFKPMGPYLVTGADPLCATTTVTVDGTVAASFPTGDMLFDPFDFISAMSRYITLRPGDVVWMGTDETAAIVPGQVVEVTIDGLGTLANPVIEEKQP